MLKREVKERGMDMFEEMGENGGNKYSDERNFMPLKQSHLGV